MNASFLIAGAGDFVALSDVFRWLGTRYSRDLPTPDGLQRYLSIQAERLPHGAHCEIIGWLAGPTETIGFRWRSEDPIHVVLGPSHEIGSGAFAFRELLVRPDALKLASDRKLDGAFEICLHTTATLIANELLRGNTLLDAFGGGYEVFCGLDGQFHRLPDVNYLFVGLRITGAETCRVYPLPIFVKSTTVGQAVLVRSFVPRNSFLAVPTDETERIALAEPIYGESMLPAGEIKDLVLTAPYYVIGVIGHAADGQEEIFTAVVSGEEAKAFRIYLPGNQKDGKDEVRFEMPDTIMNNIMAAAFQKFTRISRPEAARPAPQP